MKVIIIGAGAAGCFAGIEIKRLSPQTDVVILEKGRKALAKVAVTGGGRCNLTNSFDHVRSLEQVYPRGHRLIKKLFHQFSYKDTFQWFQNHGVQLVIQEDQCVFPASQNAMEIVSTLTGNLFRRGVRLETDTAVVGIVPVADGGYNVITEHGEIYADKVLVTTGGQPTERGYRMLERLEVEIVPSVPSLFSLCVDDDGLKSLMGTVVQDAIVSIPGTKMRQHGALLLTHWGISGPAVLKLSSHAARILAERNFIADIAIRWLDMDNDDIASMLQDMSQSNRDKQVSSIYPTQFNARLWEHLLCRSALKHDARWKELSNKDYNRIVNILTNDIYHVTGKNRFKDEFVTCGGVALSSLDSKTLEAKNHPGLYFAGEITDIDAVTGGFNLQAAWTMGYVAAHGIAD